MFSPISQLRNIPINICNKHTIITNSDEKWNVEIIFCIIASIKLALSVNLECFAREGKKYM